MHLFFDTVWKLHIGEIPEKPKGYNWKWEMPEYNRAIAAIKQNALTVGNPEILFKTEEPVLINPILEDGQFYFWPGGFETQDINNHPDKDPDYVAILTLPEEHVLTKESISSMKLKPVPEEKKNTMENMTKEQAAIKWLLDTLRPFENMEALGPIECFKIREIESLIKDPTASGSVAAPKEDAEIIKELEAKGVRSLLRENTALREALKELLTITEPSEHSYGLLELYVKSGVDKDKFNKAQSIIERARKLISK